MPGDLTISAAATLTGAGLASGDLVPVLDVSAAAGSKGSRLTVAELGIGLKTVGGVGDLLAANNLSDLANAGTARTNLGLGTIATQAASAVAITGGTIAGLTGLAVRSTGAAFDLTIASSEVLTAGRTLSFNVGDADRTLTIPATGIAALLGTANVFTAAQTITPASSSQALNLTGGSVTSAGHNLIAGSQTFNGAGVSFTALDFDIRPTACTAGDAFGSGSSFFTIRNNTTYALRVMSNGALVLGSNGATYAGLNILSSAGGGNRAAVIYDTGTPGVVLRNSGFFGISSNADAGSACVLITCDGTTAATTQFGAKSAAGSDAVDQTLKGPDVTAGSGTADKSGGDLTIASGRGTGAGAVSSLIFQTPTVGASGTTAQSLATRLTLSEGAITVADAHNFVLNTTTGSIFATATGQKMAWWGATPVVQQVLATGGGATVDNVISLLQTLGLCKQS